ncbi:MAG: polysaccharide deacetylase family protein, partial [Myxococcales bacterium]|nr:polysaccharide deacetylase family protein [Myxococcales bacterium]
MLGGPQTQPVAGVDPRQRTRAGRDADGELLGHPVPDVGRQRQGLPDPPGRRVDLERDVDDDAAARQHQRPDADPAGGATAHRCVARCGVDRIPASRTHTTATATDPDATRAATIATHPASGRGHGAPRRGGDHADAQGHTDPRGAHGATIAHAAAALLTLTATATACSRPGLDEVDAIYFHWDDERVLCATGLDDVSGNDLDSVRAGLDRALADDAVILLFTHAPGRTVALDKVEATVAYAAQIGLPTVTFAELAAGGPPRPGLSISFDDSDVDAWTATAPVLAAYDARVTFFVTRYARLSSARKAALHELAAVGHDVEAHGVDHLRGPQTVEDRGLRTYLDDEVLPSIDVLRADGYDPIAFAYPFGARTTEIDDAVLDHVRFVRSVTFTTPVPLITDPCPR